MENQEIDRREIRKKKRKRNQIIAYITFIVLFIAFVVGVFYVVNYIRNNSKKQIVEENSAVIEQLIVEEESMEKPLIEEETKEMSEKEKIDEIINAMIEVMPIEDKVAGLFMVTPEAITSVTTAIKAGEGTQEALNKYAVGGIIYFGKNIQSMDQFREMINNTLSYSKYPLFIGVDEEGGTVSRVANAGLFEKTVSAEEIGESGDTNNAYVAGEKIGSYLNQLGINLNFAPVADINNVENSVMNGRSYASTSEAASGYVVAMMKGLESSQVTAVLKHFPGIGSTTDDTHEGIVISSRTLEEFRNHEFKVFQAGINEGANVIMVSHIGAPSLSGDNTPASMSREIITDYLREELGFDGVVITDAMNMSAISEYYSSAEAAILALKAGCDMILMPENFEEAYQGILEAISDGTISTERIDDALRRIYRIKYKDKINN